MTDQICPFVSVIILNYNGGMMVLECLRHALTLDYPNYEVVVVDNCSTDNSVELIRKRFPQVDIIRNEKNLGFAAGNNVGIRSTKGEYVALLNNDVMVPSVWLKEMVRIGESDGSVGIVGSRLPSPSGEGGAGYLNPLGYSDVKKGNPPQTSQVFYVMFAAVLLRRRVLQEIGLFDESYFMFHEDIDLCWRANLSGYKVMFCRQAIAHHEHHATARGMGERKIVSLFEKNRIRTLLKNYGLKNAVIFVIISLTQKVASAVVSREASKLTIWIRGLMWNLRKENLRTLLTLRAITQSGRKVTDGQIMERMISVEETFMHLLRARPAGHR